MTKWDEFLDSASDNDLALLTTGTILPPQEDGQRNWEKWDEEHEVLHPPHPPRDVDELKKLYGENPRKNFEDYKLPGQLDEKGNDVYDWDTYRKDEHAFDRKVKHALSMGELSDVEAKSIGFYQSGGEQWHPLPHDLYHVTTNATGVEKSGKLKTRDELAMDRGHGLGGGSSDTISFTEKPETAQTIKDAMLEARSVARGDTSVADLVERARKGDKGSTPFLADIVKGWGGPGSFDNWKDGDPLPGGLQALVDGKETTSAIGTTTEEMNKEHPSPTTPWEPAPFANHWTGGDGQERYTHYQRDMTPTEKADNALDFYKKFSLWRSFHGGPEDPLFFLTDTQALAATKPEDIKVVHVQPKPRAQGFQMSALGEWRTHTGDNVDIVGTRWWHETQLRKASDELGRLMHRDWAEWDAEHPWEHRPRPKQGLKEYPQSHHEPVAALAEGGRKFAHEHGLNGTPEPDYQAIHADSVRGPQIAAWYQRLPKDDPEAHAAYDQLAKEVGQQFHYLTHDLGIDVQVVDHDPYAGPKEMIQDINLNHRLQVLSTKSTGPHPYLTNEQNDQFRAVHDAFGHAATGRGFDRNGEEAAWAKHSRMFSPLARRAMTTETRGQNSAMVWKLGTFPEQKVALLPEEYALRKLIEALLRQDADPDMDNLYALGGIHHVSLGRWPHRGLNRDWTKWDLEHRPLAGARQHIHENAAKFRAAGGTIEALNGREHGDQLRAAEQELVELHQHLRDANGGKQLPLRVEKGFQLAHVALSTGRANHTATVRIARTKEGHIAGVIATGPRGMGAGRHEHIHLAGSTGITHGAGSALLQEAMRDAAARNDRVSLDPYDEDAAQHWSGNLAAHEDPFGSMGWTPEEVKELAAA